MIERCRALGGPIRQSRRPVRSRELTAVVIEAKVDDADHGRAGVRKHPAIGKDGKFLISGSQASTFAFVLSFGWRAPWPLRGRFTRPPRPRTWRDTTAVSIALCCDHSSDRPNRLLRCVRLRLLLGSFATLRTTANKYGS